MHITMEIRRANVMVDRKSSLDNYCYVKVFLLHLPLSLKMFVLIRLIHVQNLVLYNPGRPKRRRKHQHEQSEMNTLPMWMIKSLIG